MALTPCSAWPWETGRRPPASEEVQLKKSKYWTSSEAGGGRGDGRTGEQASLTWRWIDSLGQVFSLCVAAVSAKVPSAPSCGLTNFRENFRENFRPGLSHGSHVTDENELQ